MFLSRGCEYAIQTILHLAKHPDVKYISIKKIAEMNNLSYYFLAKVTQKLKKGGLLHSYTGPNGGIGLAKRSEEINLLQIVDVMDGLELGSKCIIGVPKCDPEHPCPVHPEWQIVRQDINKMLQGKNIKQFIERE